MELISNYGRTCLVYRISKGLACKIPRETGITQLDNDCKNAFDVERQLFERLGAHPRIVRYLGPYESEGIKDGFLLGEADGGDLGSYLESCGSEINDDLRRKWSLQVAEAVAFVHLKGIIHSNLSTSNVLIHQSDLILADFGGSRCPELDLDGQLLPDDPFFDPHITDFKSPKVDVFGLGVMIYVIMTGHYPFHQGPAPLNEDKFAYGDKVRARFKQGEFPDLSDVDFGAVIAGCCCERKFETAKDVVLAIEEELRRDAY